MGSQIHFFTILTSLFFIINATGQIPLFLALLSPFKEKRQRTIIVREFCIALGILLLFTFFGDEILSILGISRPIIAVAGGVLLFLISLSMIFPKPAAPSQKLHQEPLIIPLAMPLIAGPGAMTAVMMYAHETGHLLLVASAVLAAWIPSLLIVLAGSLIKKILGEKGLVAIERLGGMLICLIGIQMLTNGIFTLVSEYYFK